MDFFLSFFEIFFKGLSSVGPFLLLLGVLVFIHELGHFLAARWCGVTVEVFSLGFGPKILKYKKGDTLYCISLFPLGGYVKMFGDNPLEEVEESEKHRGFLYKQVPQKLLIAFGGPLMNLFFTLFAFFVLSFIGVPSIPSIMGDIKKGTEAYQAGFRSGDKVLSVNDKSVYFWKEFNKLISENPNKTLSVKILNDKKEIKNYKMSPQLSENKNIFSLKKSVGSFSGLTAVSKGSQIGVLFNSPAYQAGLRTFDEIQKINGKELRYWRSIESFAPSQSGSLSLTVKRQGEEKKFVVSFSGSLKKAGIESSTLYISKIGKGTPAQKAGLKAGDRFVSIDDKKITEWRDVLETIKSYSDGVFNIRFLREGKEISIQVAPQVMYVEGQAKKRAMLGVVSGELGVLPPETLDKLGFVSSVVNSGEQTLHWLGVITVGLYRVIQGKVSVRSLGGPVTIGRIAHGSFQSGLMQFFFMMALISLNLFFLNLLPIPMLDGGHILFFSIEGILGRPLDIKKLLIAQQVGFIFLLSFFGFTFFNDIYNWLNAW